MSILNGFYPNLDVEKIELDTEEGKGIAEDFGIDIDMDDVIAMDTFKKVREIIKKYLDKKVS
ncbi:MAG: hypothetical protein IH948_01645 [Bacteroidetes bacterium]|nr:hypothetical protein [Bacteroidota bacterium]